MALAGLAVPACSGNESRDGTSGESNTGAIGLQLTLDGGVQLNSVDFVIDDGDAATPPVTGTIPVEADLSEISAYVGGLPAGSYTITLTATSVDGTTDCSGSASFTVVAGQSVGVVVPLVCGADATRGAVVVDSTLNNCPVVTSVIVAPLVNQAGYPTTVIAAAEDDNADVLTYAWTAGSGSFLAPTSPSTTYSCVCPVGVTNCTDTITLSVTDDGNGGSEPCTVTQAVPVECNQTSVCGNSVVEVGEQCDPPNATTCSDQCQNVVCGDGRTDTAQGEQCDPPNTAACTATCQTREPLCGDTWVTAPEQCEPPSTALCTETCTTRAPQCGDGHVTPPEICDDGNALDGDFCSADCMNDTTPDVCTPCMVESCPAPVATQDTRCTGGVCDAYVSCIESSGCAAVDIRACYCGTTAFDQCFLFDAAAPNGQCKTEILALGGFTAATPPIQVGSIWFDDTTALGAVNQTYLCQANNCSAQCN